MTLKQTLFGFCLLLFYNLAFADIQITDSHGKYTFKSPPKKVVVLNWALAEQMLELDVIPVGMANIKEFEELNNQLTVPATVTDVGSRLSPDLNKIKALNPDIIVIGYSQRPLTRTLSNIATVIYFKNFGHRYNNQNKAKLRYLELAKLFDKQPFAKQKLQEAASKLTELKEQIDKKYANKAKPKLQFIVPASKNSGDQIWLFGKNSMLFYAAKELGLELVALDDVDAFGVSRTDKQTVKQLNKNSETQICQFYLSNYSGNKHSQLVTNQCGGELSYQNAFGGFFSIYHLAIAISEAVLNK